MHYTIKYKVGDNKFIHAEIHEDFTPEGGDLKPG